MSNVSTRQGTVEHNSEQDAALMHDPEAVQTQIGGHLMRGVTCDAVFPTA